MLDSFAVLRQLEVMKLETPIHLRHDFDGSTYPPNTYTLTIAGAVHILNNLCALQMTTKLDSIHTFPFIEDEQANITGYGHQDKTVFVQKVNEYDEICADEIIPDIDKFSADQIRHKWVTIDANNERFTECNADTPGSIPVTTLWGWR